MPSSIGPVPAVPREIRAGTRVVEEPTIFAGPVEFQQHPKTYVDSVSGTTFDVENLVALIASNTGATNVTDFTKGADGQTIRILGDGQSTVVNGTLVKTNTGANKLLASNKVYTFTRFNNVWYEAE